ncbi:MAG TPA: hypothetical protein PLD46_00665 [Hyphomicrobium sp.]|nr:hypothetical protein [Hyphomicrobium sp.]
MAVAPVLPALAATELSRADYDNCQARDEAGLRAALVTISTDALTTGIKGINFRDVVAEQWRTTGLGSVIDKRVDIAVEEVKSETSWTERLKSLANTDASQKLATAVAERVYHSEPVKAAMEDLATGVAKDIGKSIEFASAEAAEPILQCLKAFVGPRYGSAISQAVAGDASRDMTLDPTKGSSEISAGAVLKETGGGIAGATILIVRRQMATIATRVGQRIVGSVLSRLVSVAAGGIGLVLIAKDIWEFRNGVLPIIATEMKSQATKDKVQDEIATMISEQIGEHVKEIGAASADHVVEIWQSFKRAHALVLKIAEGDAGFRTFLDQARPSSLPRLDEIVSLVVAAEGEPSVLRRLADGSLNEAVHVMPDAALTIARETRSVAKGLAWNALAGDKLPAVAEYEIYRRAEPDDFSRGALERILALDDRTAIIRIAAVSRDARDALLALDTADLKALAKSLSEQELGTLASYLNGLQEGPREQVLRAVAANPSRMQVLSSERVRDAIIASADQSAAAEMMLRPSSGFSPRAFAGDAVMAWEERISPLLLWHKHPLGVALSGGLMLILLLWFRRLFRRRPPAAPPAETA